MFKDENTLLSKTIISRPPCSVQGCLAGRLAICPDVKGPDLHRRFKTTRTPSSDVCRLSGIWRPVASSSHERPDLVFRDFSNHGRDLFPWPELPDPGPSPARRLGSGSSPTRSSFRVEVESEIVWGAGFLVGRGAGFSVVGVRIVVG
jgi:hypothetical protein